ncbi:hypothetical protein [Streptomyces californicus]|uniref:hypothetical protein n=1 Tax=Streptomyces californicus TaxID=67351 RepID=UPI00296E2DC2|nr:hypothetical protein [Streptomyces californicus]MDW4918687.1 hypothetical protein [Streptomyces californicus]
MGAALHLAHARQPAPGERHRTKGRDGSGGETFADFARQIYGDQRATPLAREMLLAFGYATMVAHSEADRDVHDVWSTARKAMGATRTGRRWRLDDAIADDAPRYVSSKDREHRACEAPRLRPHPDGPDDFRNVRGICGTLADWEHYALEKQLGTGWYKYHWFCKRHLDHLVRVREQLREVNERAPQPVPNRGGLLPVYFESDWLGTYRHRLDSPTWEPPVYGISADDWPTPGVEQVPPRARLRLAALHGTLLVEATHGHRG